MKPTLSIRKLCLLSALILTPAAYAADQAAPPSGKIHHLVVIWLKQHGDPEARRQYIEGSKRLSNLPGVVGYSVGPIADIHHDKPTPAVDDSFDIAVSATFANKEALENYSKHPEHHKVIQEVLKPLVDHYKVYDFAD